MGRKRKGASRGRGPGRHVRRPSLTGTVRLGDNGAFVQTAEGEFKLRSRASREVMAGDTVAVSLASGPHGEKRAMLEGTLERAAATVMGTYAEAGPLGVVRPLDTRLRADFFVLPQDTSAARLGVAEGDVVVARIVEYPTIAAAGVVTLERRVGELDGPDVGIRFIMARWDLEDGYPDAAQREAEELVLDVDGALAADALRRDIRDRFLLTIDPVDARDFDDAISIERTARGGYRLGVHIADVSHYVAWESSIDLEARRRSTSVYLADRVLPMLPERLSCDLCSLVPDEDRLAFTVDIELDGEGRVRSYRAFPSAIRSRVRLDYDAAEALLEGEGGAAASDAEPDVLERAQAAEAAARACGQDLRAFLALADELAGKRAHLRAARGAIDFDTVEVRALLDEEGTPTAIRARRRTRATGLIEEAMLIANECVAEMLAERDVPCAYRVHEPPSPDALFGAARVLAELGIIDAAEMSAIAAGDQRAMRAVVKRAADTDTAPLVNALLLRAMQRAHYKAANEGHYALGAPAYCHFTSPIRRYPDLLVHRALKVELARERLGERAARERARSLTGVGRECLPRIVAQLCRAASDAERAADAAASASQKVKIAQFFAGRVGERFAGCVSWVDRMGAFVRLDDYQVEGLVPMRALGQEWFELDEDKLTLTGASSGKRISLGCRAVVEVTGADTIRGHLNLRFVHVQDAGPRSALH